LLAEDDLDAPEPFLTKKPARRGGRSTALAGFGIADVDAPVGRELRVESQIEKPALALRENRRNARERL
jgi:hypothetical protein